MSLIKRHLPANLLSSDTHLDISSSSVAAITPNTSTNDSNEATETDRLVLPTVLQASLSSSSTSVTTSFGDDQLQQHAELSFNVDYLGFDQLSEAQSLPVIMETLKRIKKEQTNRPIRVDFIIRDGLLRVSNVEQGSLLITAPLYAVAYCAQEHLRGFDSAFAINITSKRIHYCHIFEAGSRLEASSIVRAVAVSFKSVGRLLRERRERVRELESTNSLKSYDSRIRTDSEGSKSRFQIERDSSSEKPSNGITRDHNEESRVMSTRLGTGPVQRISDVETTVLIHSAVRNNQPGSVSSSDNEVIPEYKPVYEQTVLTTTSNQDVARSSKSISTASLFKLAVNAINRDDKESLIRCLDDGLSINAENQHNASLLHHAVTWSRTAIVTYLLERGADPNWEDDKDQTPLHCSAAIGKRAITKLLLLHGANVRAKDRKFRTPLHLCAGCLQSLEVSYILVEFGARIEDNDLIGTRPVDLQLELREMQTRLIQSACEAFASSETIRSRSSSSSSTKSSSLGSRYVRKSSQFSPLLIRKKESVGASESVNLATSLPTGSLMSMKKDEAATVSGGEEGLGKGVGRMSKVKQSGSFNSSDHVTKERDGDVLSPSFSKLFKRDPAAESLDLLVTLSANPECHASILANLCLPKASGQLVALALQDNPCIEHLEKITTLISNMFSVAGPESRRRSVEAGLLKTVIDLLNGPEPIQGTCLSILSDLLQMHSDKDYSTAISSIPLDPLLVIIQRTDTESEADPCLVVYDGMTRILSAQGFDSPATRSPLIKRRLIASNEQSSRRNETGSNERANMKDLGRGRSGSQESRGGGSRDSSPAPHANNKTKDVFTFGNDKKPVDQISLKLAAPRTRIPSQPLMTASGNTVRRDSAKRIAVKMISACSTSPKLQLELAKESVCRIIMDCLANQDQHIVLWSVLTVANMLCNRSIHQHLDLNSVGEQLQTLLCHNDERVCYHATRGLVYMGLDGNEAAYLFKYLEGADSSAKFAIYSQPASSSDTSYIKGASLERTVFLLTESPLVLWGGVKFPPPSPGEKRPRYLSPIYHAGSKGQAPFPNEYQVYRFFLTTYKSFVEPVILLRLLIHRFYHPIYMANMADPQSDIVTHQLQLPKLHMRLMRIWVMWIECFPGDFIDEPSLADEFVDVLEVMRLAGGPYTMCAYKMDQLLAKTKECESSSVASSKTSTGESHHDVLYDQCQKAISSGALPCTEEDFIYLAGLHLYIEDLCDFGSLFLRRVDPAERVTSSRLKQSVHPSVASSKFYLKRIRSQYELFLTDMPTERNAKHNYIDCCQSIPGYACKFFKLKLQLPGRNGRKGTLVSRLLGVGSKRIAVLDSKTKACLNKWPFKELRRWETSQDETLLDMIFRKEILRFQLDNKGIFKELTNLIFNCTTDLKWQGLCGLETTPWSDLAQETGYWGSQGLEVYLQTSKRDSMYGNRLSCNPCRERAATICPSTREELCSSKSSLKRAQSYVVRPVSHSAPLKEDNGVGSYLSEWLPFGSGRKSDEKQDQRDGPNLNSVSDTDDNLNGPSSRRPRTLSIAAPADSILPLPSKPLHKLTPIEEKTPMLSVIDSKMLEMERGECPIPVSSQIKTCRCPPDADLPNLNRSDFSAFELLQHSKELARQITLLDHSAFRKMTPRDIQNRIFGSVKRNPNTHDSKPTSVETVAQRFNQLSNWVTYSIVSERNIERRAQLIRNFIEAGKQCLELKNYNAVMAIIVAALGSAPVRRLIATKQLLMPEYASIQCKMEALMDSKHNYKKYRDALRTSPTPAVPYFGLYLKDLTFIGDGNPDLLRGGLINVNKRRQVYVVLLEVKRFQRKTYNFQEVPEIRDYLLSRPFVNEDDMHRLSREVEPSLPARLTSLSISSSSSSSHPNEKRGSISVPIFKSLEKSATRKLSGKPQRLGSLPSDR